MPAVPLPAFIAHGRDDPRLPFATDGARADQRLLGAVGSAATWAETNGCFDDPATSRSREGAVDRRTWCAEGASPVVLLGVDGWGHDWPGPRKTDKLPSSDPLQGFHLAEEMWDFLSRHSVPVDDNGMRLTDAGQAQRSSGFSAPGS